MEQEQQLLMLFETNAIHETEKFNKSNKKQALLEERDRTTRLLSFNSKLYQTSELMNPSKQKHKRSIENPESPCDLNKSRYAASSDLPKMKKTKRSQREYCLSPKNETNKEISSGLGNKQNTQSKFEDNKPQNSIISNGSELKSDTQSSITSNSSPISETRSSFTFPTSPKNSDDKGSQTVEQDESINYWNCENCSGEKSRKSSNLPILKKGGGFGFMGAEMDYQISDKPKIEVDICPPLEIIQPTFNDFYEVDADWLEESVQCPYEDIVLIDAFMQAPSVEEESLSSFLVDPCENMESMTDWERCLAGCCEEACEENQEESQEEEEFQYNCEEEFIVCDDDDCDI
ncbi:hypothetical protein LSTR_LSTR005552 [Laodelphax striatellus]|uniref:Uncharacterized protein n=1 Tax=Laodelphax striatellus TaxID=195883 RepID=A0A482WYD7_LAOST|nr:hypothetical protein LSTR_LSTR005552 [Laodelphax striatellus]